VRRLEQHCGSTETITRQRGKDDGNQNEAEPCPRVVRVAHLHDDNIIAETRE